MYEIGIDIENIDRFEKRLNDNSFLESIFTEKELTYCFSKAHPAQHLAARFCAKEACFKALKGEFEHFDKIEILNGEDGSPYLKILDKKYENCVFKVSMSHTKEYANAVVLYKPCKP